MNEMGRHSFWSDALFFFAKSRKKIQGLTPVLNTGLRPMCNNPIRIYRLWAIDHLRFNGFGSTRMREVDEHNREKISLPSQL